MCEEEPEAYKERRIQELAVIVADIVRERLREKYGKDIIEGGLDRID